MRSSSRRAIILSILYRTVISCGCLVPAGLKILSAQAIDPSESQHVWNVEIEALGQKNEKSQGDEVWIYEIRTPQEVLEWKNAQQPGPRWEFRPRTNAAGGQAALAIGGTPKLLRAVLHGDSLSIKFIQHAWSGKVRVTVNNETRMLDLYSPEEPSLETLRFGAPKAPDGTAPQGRNPWPYAGGAVGILLLLVLFVRRARRGARSPESRVTRASWLGTAKHRLFAAALIGIVPFLPLSRVMFGSARTNPTTSEYLLGYGYSVGLLFGILTLWWLCDRPAEEIASPSGGCASRQYWAIAVILSALAATGIAMVTENSLNAQHAYWVKLTVDTDAPQPPQLALRYGKGSKEVTTFQWQPYTQTILSMRRLGAVKPPVPVRVERIQADYGPVNIDDVVVQGGIRSGGVVAIAAPYGGMLRWVGAARRITFSVSGGTEPVRFYWLDQSRVIQVGPSPRVVSFDLGGTYQGWALLPPQEIDSLSIVPAAPIRGTYSLTGQLPQSGNGDVHFGPSTLHAFSWPLSKPVNERRPVAIAIAWLTLFCAGLLFLFLVYRLSLFFENQTWLKRLQRSAVRGTPPDIMRFVSMALPIWLVCACFQLAFDLSVRTAFTNDSIGYYGMARDFLHAPFLQDIVVARTPGYPLFLSAVLAAFGDTVLGIATLQHVALAFLPVVSMWCLWDHLPRPWVGIAGLLAGLSPAVAPTANVVWTEALFCVLASSALLFATCWRRGDIYMLLAGICGGLATMFRPNGLLALGVISGFLVLHFFWSRLPGRVYARAGAALIGGYLMIAAPWHLHLAVKRETLALGKGLSEFGAWAGFVYERRLPVDLPVNLPNQAIFADPLAYNNDPYIAKATYPLLMGDEQTYYRETQAEWLSSQSWSPYLEAWKFHSTLVWNPATLPVAFDEVRWINEGWKHAPAAPPPPGDDVTSILSRLTAASPPGPDWLRMVCLNSSTFVLDHWAWLAAIALLGVVTSAFLPSLILPAAYCTISVFVYSTNLVPAERYIAVLEPFYYILGVGFLYVLAKAIHQRRSADGNDLPHQEAASRIMEGRTVPSQLTHL